MGIIHHNIADSEWAVATRFVSSRILIETKQSIVRLNTGAPTVNLACQQCLGVVMIRDPGL